MHKLGSTSANQLNPQLFSTMNFESKSKSLVLLISLTKSRKEVYNKRKIRPFLISHQ